MTQVVTVLFLCLFLGCQHYLASAEVSLPAIFSDRMVLQRDMKNRVWGWAEPGEQVIVSIKEQKHLTTADETGLWEVSLGPMPAGGPYEMKVRGTNAVTRSGILVGEVWLCSGQSNMEWPVECTDDADLELMTGTDTRIRLLTIPHIGTQEPQRDFQGHWVDCTPATAREFSAVGYYFAKQLVETLNVPVGMIDNSWGGSACEAWVDRERLATDERFKPLNDFWIQYEKTYDHQHDLAEYRKLRDHWMATDKKEKLPEPPVDRMTFRDRPGNLYNGVLYPLFGYGIKGVIWYQGETNVERASQYRELFPFMISNWRDVWQIGDFSFYWAQLANINERLAEPGESSWAELREAQLLTLRRLSNVGQAVLIDRGEANNTHPGNKRDVALRLVRLALANDYGQEITCIGPTYESMTRFGRKVVITFDIGRTHDGDLQSFDTDRLVGFTIAGKNRKFVTAAAQIIARDQVEVWQTDIVDPVAVRYAWADNPECNLLNRAGLPASPFRTDDWPSITEGNQTPRF